MPPITEPAREPAAKTARSKVVCLCDDAGEKAALASALADAGFEITAPEAIVRKATVPQGTPSQGTAPADIGLIDLRRHALTEKKARSIAALLRRGSPDCRLFFLVGGAVAAESREALRRHGEVVPAGRDIAHVIERFRRAIRLRNIAEETAERLKSLTAMNRLAAFPPVAASSAPPKLLIAGEPGPVALEAANALRGGADACVSVFSSGQVMRALDVRRFDALVIAPAGEHDPLLTLARTLRRHPKHFALPVIAVAASEEDAALFGRKGASDVILASHLGADLRVRAALSARRSRLLQSMKLFLNACAGDGVRDPASSAFTAAFALEHGARLCARADQTQRPLSAVVVRLQNAYTGAEPSRAALPRAAHLIRRLVRAEDLAARIAPATFLVLMPATAGGGAQKAALRIQGVLENTVFRGDGERDLFSMRVAAGVDERADGACMEETAARALARLRENEKARDAAFTARPRQSRR